MNFNPYKKFNGSLIPDWLEKRSINEISQGAKLLYGKLIFHNGKNNKCFPSRKILAIELGVKEDQIKYYLKQLKQHKLIKINSRPGHSNEFIFLYHSWMIGGENQKDAEKQKDRDYPSFDLAFEKALKQEFNTHPIIWHAWKDIQDWDRRNLRIDKLKYHFKGKYEYYLEKWKNGEKLKIP